MCIRDSSSSEDFTSACLEFPLDDGRVFVLSHSWIPQAKIDADRENMGNSFKEWVEHDWLTIVPGEFVHKEDCLLYTSLPPAGEQGSSRGESGEGYRAGVARTPYPPSLACEGRGTFGL